MKIGPSFCVQCDSWPGIYGPHQNLCTICDDQRHAFANPVPLPRDPQLKADIVRLYRSTGTPLPPSYEEIYDIH